MADYFKFLATTMFSGPEVALEVEKDVYLVVSERQVEKWCTMFKRPSDESRANRDEGGTGE